MIAILASAVVRWMADHPGQRPEIRALRHSSIDPGDRVEVWSDPSGVFAPDMFVIARAGEDFIVSEMSSTSAGVVFTVVNVSRTSMPRRFDGWLVGRDPFSATVWWRGEEVGRDRRKNLRVGVD